MLILGTGALASLFAARLAATGVQITMLGSWQAAIEALNKEGVSFTDADGNENSFPVTATDDPAKCTGVQYALVLVKAWQTQRAAQQLGQCLGADGLAVTLQNGAGNREMLQAALGVERVATGVTTTGATLLGPGQIKAGGEGLISLGSHPKLRAVADTLLAADFNVEILEDVDSLIWGKLVVNAAINPLTAILGVPNGELLARPESRQLMAELAKEVAAVAAAQNIQLPFEDAVVAAEDVARRTASNHSSMLQDVQRGAPTEIDAICGAVVEAGKIHGIPTPVNDTMWKLVKAKVNSR
ncbi:MAG: 2-dehydropantoate 2-reductase [Chloroflexi bacterium]|nr:MAG: 2-dehydropantoate 2-reductase [Chloroflexota bacterium]MBL1194325.1 2-dehydropantoate 2-reductase [Chloroflexota bacterium]NOH11615.1 2-dehydropantoate 2-reductase [Chloroflexota bacterium]